MLTTGEWCNSQQHVAPCVKVVEWGLSTERFGNVSSVLGRHPGRGYNLHRRPAKSHACRCSAIGTPLYNMQRDHQRILTPPTGGKVWISSS